MARIAVRGSPQKDKLLFWAVRHAVKARDLPKDLLRGCAQELPGEVDLMGHPKSNIWPIWTRCLHPNRWKRAIRLFAL